MSEDTDISKSSVDLEIKQEIDEIDQLIEDIENINTSDNISTLDNVNSLDVASILDVPSILNNMSGLDGPSILDNISTLNEEDKSMGFEIFKQLKPHFERFVKDNSTGNEDNKISINNDNVALEYQGTAKGFVDAMFGEDRGFFDTVLTLY